MKKLKINAFADEANPGIDIQIKALKRNGLDGIEIRNADGENVSDISPEKAAEIKNKFDAEGLDIFSLGSPIGKINADEDPVASPIVRQNDRSAVVFIPEIGEDAD